MNTLVDIHDHPPACTPHFLSTRASFLGVTYTPYQCFCGTASSSSAVTNCDYPCTGDSSEICGGFNAINLYVYGAGDDDTGVYLGCYGDSKSGRIMGNKVSNPGMNAQVLDESHICGCDVVCARRRQT